MRTHVTDSRFFMFFDSFFSGDFGSTQVTNWGDCFVPFLRSLGVVLKYFECSVLNLRTFFNFFEPLGAPLTNILSTSKHLLVPILKRLLPGTTSLMWDGN